jgi:hypothetical protein
MGMFDRVIVGCPGCGMDIEFQSKAGDCELRSYDLDTAPPNILGDLNGETVHCQTCGRPCIIRVRIIALAT